MVILIAGSACPRAFQCPLSRAGLARLTKRALIACYANAAVVRTVAQPCGIAVDDVRLQARPVRSLKCAVGAPFRAKSSYRPQLALQPHGQHYCSRVHMMWAHVLRQAARYSSCVCCLFGTSSHASGAVLNLPLPREDGRRPLNHGNTSIYEFEIARAT